MKIKRWAVWSNSAQRFDCKSFISRSAAVRRHDKIIKSQAYNLGIGKNENIPGFIKMDLVVAQK